MATWTEKRSAACCSESLRMSWEWHFPFTTREDLCHACVKNFSILLDWPNKNIKLSATEWHCIYGWRKRCSGQGSGQENGWWVIVLSKGKTGQTGPLLKVVVLAQVRNAFTDHKRWYTIKQEAFKGIKTRSCGPLLIMTSDDWMCKTPNFPVKSLPSEDLRPVSWVIVSRTPDVPDPNKFLSDAEPVVPKVLKQIKHFLFK